MCIEREYCRFIKKDDTINESKEDNSMIPVMERTREKFIQDFEAYVENFELLPDTQKKEKSLEFLKGAGVLDEDGNIREYFQHSFKKIDE